MLERLLVVAAVLAVASVAWWWWSRRQGVVTTVDNASRLTTSQLGATPGEFATFVQFSTPMCSKCPPTARLLQSVAAERPHVRHVEIDASERLDLARQFDIMRTPTTLVLDGNGVVVARMAGAPHPDQARQALDTVPPPTEYSI